MTGQPDSQQLDDVVALSSVGPVASAPTNPSSSTAATDAEPVGPGLSLRVDWVHRRLHLTGQLDCATAVALPIVILAAARPFATGDVAVDVTELDFIDASGLGALVAARTQAACDGVVLRVAGASGRIRRVFELGRLTAMLDDAAVGPQATRPHQMDIGPAEVCPSAT